MTARKLARYFAVILTVSAALLSAVLPYRAHANTRSKTRQRVQVQLGKPAVWSMAQAHYLLSKMRKKNGELTTHMPGENDLDPNAVNATRLQVLRTLLGIEAQFNENVGVKNQAALREQQFKLQQRDDARTQLVEKENELALLQKRLTARKREVAELKAEDAIVEEARAAAAKKNKKDKDDPEIKPPLTDAEQTTKKDIGDLDAKIAEMESQKTALNSEISTLRTQSTAQVDSPTLVDAPLNSTTAAQLQTPNNLDKFVTQALDNMRGKPSVAASIALDNFIGMQYEIIAKQMTLLRDEIGPDERIVFLELPSSVYTVPGAADDYMVQVEWEANWYCDASEKDDSDINSADKYSSREQGQRISFPEIELRWLRDRLDLSGDALLNIVNEVTGKKYRSQADIEDFERSESSRLDINWRPVDIPETIRQPLLQKLIDKRALTSLRYKSTVGSSTQQNNFANLNGKRARVRALDVIPRQSALNINDYHATSNNLNFLGVMKLLIGLGIKVDYQRQKDLYEQYLQQEVFASGYGKGDRKFGWTFGPMPGTHRVVPGPKTTYAVLAVPRNTAAIELTARSRAFPRCTSPESTSAPIIEETVFLVGVPGEYTDNFYVENIAYTPVKKGEPVTAIIKGDYFSPQLGILVNGVPLTRALAVTSNENQTSECNFSAGKISGCYEQVSSREMVLNFSMGNPAYGGTPTITLVSPEKSSAVNFYRKVLINYRYTGSLQKYSEMEPMFTDELSLNQNLTVTAQSGTLVHGEAFRFVKAILTGRGMRPEARIFVDNKLILNRSALFKRLGFLALPPDQEYIQQLSTNAYEVYFKQPARGNWKLRFEQNTRQGLESKEIEVSLDSPQPSAILRYDPPPPGAPQTPRRGSINPPPSARVVIKFASIDPSKFSITNVTPTSSGVTFDFNIPANTQNNTYQREYLVAPVDGHEQESASFDVTTTDVATGAVLWTKAVQVTLPLRPVIESIENPRITGVRVDKAQGFIDEEPQVIIHGRNLQKVAKVYFGDQAVTPIGNNESTTLLVKVPKIDHIKYTDNDGVTSSKPRYRLLKKQVPVKVETSQSFEPTKVSGALFYTYLEKAVIEDSTSSGYAGRHR